MGSEIWKKCLDYLEDEIPAQQFDTCIRPLQVEDAADGLQLFSPNKYIMDLVSDMFLPRIRELVTDLGAGVVSIEVGSNPGRDKKHTNGNGIPGSITGNGLVRDIDMEFTFSTFVEGRSNVLARAAALQVAENVALLHDGVVRLAQEIPQLIDGAGAENAATTSAKLLDGRISDELAVQVSWFDELFAALDIVSVANAQELDVQEVAQAYVELGQRLELHWLRDCIVALPRENRWQALARAALRDDLFSCERALTADVLASAQGRSSAEQRVDGWLQDNAAALQRCRQVLDDLHSAPQADFAMLSVAMGEIRALQR